MCPKAPPSPGPSRGWRLWRRRRQPPPAGEGADIDHQELGPEPRPPLLSPPEIDLLARLVKAEAEGEPYPGQVAVAAVVLNRLHSPLFPNDVTQIIYQPGQFEAVSIGRIEEPAEEVHVAAVRDALAGPDPTEGALFFFNPDRTTNKYMHSLPVTARIGRHTFA